MKTFRFNLERVLEWRTIQLRSAEETLSQLTQQLSVLVQQEKAVVVAYRSHAERLLAMPSVDGSELQALAAYRIRTNNLHQAIQREMAQCESLIFDQRTRLLKARKEHRILERLKETRWKSWLYLRDRELESTASEAYLSKWARMEAERQER